MNCDLHTHSNHSDGSSTPAELVAEAKEKNLIIALTDHNTVTGLSEFLSEAKRLGVTAVGGTELSTVHEFTEYHLLGLFIDDEFYKDIDALCKEYHYLKERSNILLVERLREAGYIIDYSVIKQNNVKGNVNRAHIALELKNQGYVSSISEAFDKLLGENCDFYIPPKRLEIIDAIRFLRGIRAMPILAHPLKDTSPEELRNILPELIEAGLVGIETMHSSYSDEKIAISKEIAKEFNLLESGGSDFHGKFKPTISLGVGEGNLDIPDTVYYNLLKYRNDNL